MKIVLFSSALFQMLLGAVVFVWVIVALSPIFQEHSRSVRGWLLVVQDALPVPALLMGLGGIQCAITRLAYPPVRRPDGGPVASPPIAMEPTGADGPQRPRRPVMERVLGVLALSLFGTGLIVFCGGYYLEFRTGSNVRVHYFAQLWWVSLGACVLASLGGILWALTRIAYPRATRPG